MLVIADIFSGRSRGTLTDIVLIATVITAFGIIWLKVLRPIAKQARRMEDEHVAELIGAVATELRDHIHKVDDAVETIHQQLQPNGGSSLVDQVKAMSTKVAEIARTSERAEESANLTRVLTEQTRDMNAHTVARLEAFILTNNERFEEIYRDILIIDPTLGRRKDDPK